MTPDYRLRAYGPCLDLARKLSRPGPLDRRRPVPARVRDAKWDDERVRGWLEQAQRGERPGGL